jgi:putative ABC transport system permease protein
MFLAWRELKFARYRFSLMGGVVALIAVLVVLLSGLSSGLVNDGVSGLQRIPATAFAFAGGTKTDSAFSRSTIDLAQVGIWKAQPGVADAAPFGNLLVNAKTDRGQPVDLALFGVDPRSFLAPKVADGADLGTPVPDPTTWCGRAPTRKPQRSHCSPRTAGPSTSPPATPPPAPRA